MKTEARAMKTTNLIFFNYLHNITLKPDLCIVVKIFFFNFKTFVCGKAKFQQETSLLFLSKGHNSGTITGILTKFELDLNNVDKHFFAITCKIVG